MTPLVASSPRPFVRGEVTTGLGQNLSEYRSPAGDIIERHADRVLHAIRDALSLYEPDQATDRLRRRTQRDDTLKISPGSVIGTSIALFCINFCIDICFSPLITARWICAPRTHKFLLSEGEEFGPQSNERFVVILLQGIQC